VKNNKTMSKIIINPAKRLRGEITVPGDKSISHRAVMLGSLARGETYIKGFLPGEDCLCTVNALKQMGVQIRALNHNPHSLLVEGKGLHGLTSPRNILYLGNSGTSMRLLSGIMAGQRFSSILDGDESLRSRPMGRVINPLKLMGTAVRGEQGDKYPPLHFSPATALHGITYSSPIASAQVKSALLLAGLYAGGETKFIEPAKSRDHTERMFRQFGVPFWEDGLTIGLEGLEDCDFSGQKVVVPGDFSSAAFFIVAALIVPDSELLIKGVGINPTRTGLLEVLKAMGAHIKLLNEHVNLPEPMADIYIKSGALSGINVSPEIVLRMIDEFPIFCIAAALAEGKTSITGAAELRVKETDRIRSMSQGLRLMGVEVTEAEDGLQIKGQPRLSGAPCQSHKDHRTAMALAVAGLMAEKETEINDIDCVATSFPGFFELLAMLKA
jgi:3-phosphoshikimate 1-carboxyvinyltransferase